MVAQVVPVYGNDLPVGRTKKEIATTFNTSNHFLKQPVNYRGQYRSELDGDR